ncbi:unnamed protein product, partial [Effrenium voratum]
MPSIGIHPRLLRLCCVVVSLHGVAAVCTEYVFQVPGFAFGLFYTFAQCFTFTLLALAKAAVGGLSLNMGAVEGSAIAGLSMTVSHGCGILSYLYVNYTTSMVFKSAKVPSVLLAGRVLNHGQRAANELWWALCMM